MFKQISAMVVAGFIATGFSLSTVAEETPGIALNATPAKIIVYRSDEKSLTKKIKFNVLVDSAIMGRLKYGNSVATSVPAGKYSIDTSIKGDSALQLDVKPGQTYYVFSKLTRLGHKVMPELVVVEEQVALSHQPELDGAI